MKEDVKTKPKIKVLKERKEMMTHKIKMCMKILLLFMCSSIGNVFCSLWKLMFTTKLTD